MAGKISEYPAKEVYNDNDLLDFSTGGTVSEKATYLEVKNNLKDTFHSQDGNLYGEDMVVGNDDDFDVKIVRNGQLGIIIEENSGVSGGTNVHHDDYSTFGDVDGGIMQSLPIKISMLPEFTYTAGSGTSMLNTGIQLERIWSWEIKLRVGGKWIGTRHTDINNADYNAYMGTNGDTNGWLHIRAEASETAINSSRGRLIVYYTDIVI